MPLTACSITPSCIWFLGISQPGGPWSNVPGGEIEQHGQEWAMFPFSPKGIGSGDLHLLVCQGKLDWWLPVYRHPIYLGSISAIQCLAQLHKKRLLTRDGSGRGSALSRVTNWVCLLLMGETRDTEAHCYMRWGQLSEIDWHMRKDLNMI